MREMNHNAFTAISKTCASHSFVSMQIDSALETSHATSVTAPKLVMQCSPPSTVPQYARRHPRHCAPYAAVYAVPQYTAASYTVLLNLGMVSIERFPCGHSDATKQDFSQNFFFHTVFQKETLLNSNTC